MTAEPEAAVMLGRSALYSYDGLHRLAEADYGRLNGGRTDLTDEWADPAQIVYTMDILGNMTSLDRKNSGTSAAETRTHNATNELTGRTVTGEAPRYWFNDPFADNDTGGWAVANLNTGGSDGSWSAGSGKLNCTGVCTPTGHSGIAGSDADQGSILLIDGPYYQDVWIEATYKLGSAAENCGIVFGYVDAQNFWVLLKSKAQQKTILYKVTSGTWSNQYEYATTIANDTTYTMTAEVTAGNAAVGIGGTVVAGQVGLWCSHGSANEFDDFVVRDEAGPYLAAVGWYSNVGAVQVDASNGNTIMTGAPDYRERTVWYDGFRGGKFVLTYRFKWNTGEGVQPGALVRYVDNGNWLAVYVATADGTARLRKREADAPPATVTTSATALSLTTNTWYSGKVVIGDDLGNSALQRLRFWVDTDDDGDWSDETALLDTTAIDDVWSAG